MPNQDSRSEKLNATKLFNEIRMCNKLIADIKENLKDFVKEIKSKQESSNTEPKGAVHSFACESHTYSQCA